MDKKLLELLELELRKMIRVHAAPDFHGKLSRVNFRSDGSTEVTNSYAALRVKNSHDGEVDPLEDYPDTDLVWQRAEELIKDGVSVEIYIKQVKDHARLQRQFGYPSVVCQVHPAGLTLSNELSKDYLHHMHESDDDRQKLRESIAKADYSHLDQDYFFQLKVAYLENALLFFEKLGHKKASLHFAPTKRREVVIEAGDVQYLIALIKMS
ncbi:hypothetical protein [Alloiococcus otitis]|uniref:hypothetical protein n=1 Tax=Alloiococcus otitis TaxID=1652 RepID=UPI0002E7980C|nr:hypothetical protein [Alloiococcus otitis]